MKVLTGDELPDCDLQCLSIVFHCRRRELTRDDLPDCDLQCLSIVFHCRRELTESLNAQGISSLSVGIGKRTERKKEKGRRKKWQSRIGRKGRKVETRVGKGEGNRKKRKT